MSLRHINYNQLIVIFLILSMCNCGSVNLTDISSYLTTNQTLKSVHIIFRHGHRTPIEIYPKDPYANETFTPYGLGHLTNEGKQLLYQCGEYLRKRYDEFLGKNYQPDLVYAETTNIYRTYMSLSLLLAGLFPSVGSDMNWNSELNWQPIPIVTTNRKYDNIISTFYSCPRVHEAISELYQSPSYLKDVINNDLYEELTNLSGKFMRTPSDIIRLYGTLLSEEEYGLKLPFWTQKYYPNLLKKLSKDGFLYNTFTNELKRLQFGPLLVKMFNDWKNKMDEQLNDRKKIINLYGGQDLTIINILNSLNIQIDHYPGYGIMIIFELIHDHETEQYGIKMYLKLKSDHDLISLTVPGCQMFCPIEEFQKLTMNLLAFNSINDCKLKNPDFKIESTFTINCEACFY